MENEDVIRHQMEDTRTSLTEKLETLEEKVASTVQGATTNVADTVEAVKDTVEAVKDSVQETVTSVRETVDDTISAVKEGVQEGLAAVKDVFDVPAHVRAHPWLMFGGSIAAGFMLESLLGKPARRTSAGGAYQKKSLAAGRTTESRSESPRSSTSALAGMLTTFEPEIARLKGLAVGAALSAVRDAVVRAVPQDVAPNLAEIIDSATRKLGGESLKHETTSPPKQREVIGERFNS